MLEILRQIKSKCVHCIRIQWGISHRKRKLLMIENVNDNEISQGIKDVKLILQGDADYGRCRKMIINFRPQEQHKWNHNFVFWEIKQAAWTEIKRGFNYLKVHWEQLMIIQKWVVIEHNEGIIQKYVYSKISTAGFNKRHNESKMSEILRQKIIEQF